MIHGFAEITHTPVDKKTCEEYIEQLRMACGVEPLGCNLAIKHSTPTEYVVMCFFATPEGYEYASRLTHDPDLFWEEPIYDGRRIVANGRTIRFNKETGESTADSTKGNLRQIDSAKFSLSFSEDKGNLGTTAEHSSLVGHS